MIKVEEGRFSKLIYGKIKSDQGVIFIGDICYALDKKLYDKYWGDKFNYEDGFYEMPNGYAFVVASTAYGDGTYYDNMGDEFSVDAGVIGAVPIELWDVSVNRSRLEKLGKVVGVKKVSFYAEDGIFDIRVGMKTIRIDTLPEDSFYDLMDEVYRYIIKNYARLTPIRIADIRIDGATMTEIRQAIDELVIRDVIGLKEDDDIVWWC